MQWMLLLKSAYQPRVESRILQVLGKCMAEVESFSSMRMAHDIWVTLVMKAEHPYAERVRGRMGRIQGIKRLQLFRNEEALSRTTAVVKIWCDQDFRLPILQVLSSIEAKVLAMTPMWMAFEVIGPFDSMAGLHDVLYPYGIIESFSAASLLVHTETEKPDQKEAVLSAVTG